MVTRPTMAIMRPRRYEPGSIQVCEQAGFDVISAPMIRILDKKDDNFDGFVDRVLSGLSDFVIFTSASGIDHTLDKVPDREQFISALNRGMTIAIGPKTAEAARDQGINISLLPESYSSQGLVEAIEQDVAGRVVDIARSSHGAPELVEGLELSGAAVYETRVYEIARPRRNESQEALVRALMEGEVDVVVFTSSMMVRNLFELALDMGVQEGLIRALKDPGLMVAAIGRPTANTLNIYKIPVNIIAREYTFEALVNEVRKEFYN